MKFLTDGRV